MNYRLFTHFLWRMQRDFLVSSGTLRRNFFDLELSYCESNLKLSMLIKVITFLCFSSEHFSYVQHDCPAANNRDNQVPVCPMCMKPVPSVKGQEDRAVSEHIDQYCKTETKIYTNSCSFGKCKKRELVPFSCSSCKLNYCLKHRHADVHDCKARSQSSQREMLA